MTKSLPSIWHLPSKRQIDGEDYITFCGFFRKHELYYVVIIFYKTYFRKNHSEKV
jgi:hypothetical protein